MVLSQWLALAPAAVLLAAAVFTRVGAAMAVLPGIGEAAIPMRLRLALTLAISAVVLPALWPTLMPEIERARAAAGPAVGALVLGLVAAEAVAGLLIGLAFRFTVFALQIAGTVAAQNITISHLFGNPATPEPEPSIASLLAMGGTTLALIAGLHVDAVAALARLYAVLPLGAWPGTGDAAAWTTARAAEAFALGVGLATPFVLVGFAYNLALGALSRAMPQLLLTLVGVPLLVGLGLLTLWLATPELFARWGEALGRVLADPLGGFLGAAPPAGSP